jgi:hypothetical protein
MFELFGLFVGSFFASRFSRLLNVRFELVFIIITMIVSEMPSTVGVPFGIW